MALIKMALYAIQQRIQLFCQDGHSIKNVYRKLRTVDIDQNWIPPNSEEIS